MPAYAYFLVWDDGFICGLADAFAEHGYEVLRPTRSYADFPGHDYDELDERGNDCALRVKLLLVGAAVRNGNQFLDKLFRYLYSHYEGKKVASRGSGEPFIHQGVRKFGRLVLHRLNFGYFD